MYSPVSIRVDYQCSLSCETQPYFRKRVYIPLDFNGTNFTELKPGSKCKFTFAVFYNPSEFDRGVRLFLGTVQSSKAYTYDRSHDFQL